MLYPSHLSSGRVINTRNLLGWGKNMDVSPQNQHPENREAKVGHHQPQRGNFCGGLKVGFIQRQALEVFLASSLLQNHRQTGNRQGKQ